MILPILVTKLLYSDIFGSASAQMDTATMRIERSEHQPNPISPGATKRTETNESSSQQATSSLVSSRDFHQITSHKRQTNSSNLESWETLSSLCLQAPTS